jgi:hypothetical protein
MWNMNRLSPDTRFIWGHSKKFETSCLRVDDNHIHAIVDKMATNNSIAIDSSTVELKKRSDRKVEFIDSVEESNNKYRWYLCKESTPARWECEHTTAHQALFPYTRLDAMRSHEVCCGVYGGAECARERSRIIENTTAIPIYKFIPQSFDNMILNRTIRSMTHVKIVPPTTAAEKHN